MAVMQSPVFNSIRGSIGGATYFTTPAGQIICRNRTHPVNPQTALQTARRVGFAFASNEWEVLSDAEKQLWQDYADSLGAGKHGRSTFIANITIARWAYDLNAAVPTVKVDSPTDPGVLPINNVVMSPYTAVGTGIKIQATNPNIFDIVFLVQRSRLFSSARKRLQGPFIASTSDAIAVNGAGLLSYDFEDLIEDGIYFVRLVAVRKDDFHIVSASYILRGIAEKNVV